MGFLSLSVHQILLDRRVRASASLGGGPPVSWQKVLHPARGGATSDNWRRARRRPGGPQSHPHKPQPAHLWGVHNRRCVVPRAIWRLPTDFVRSRRPGRTVGL